MEDTDLRNSDIRNDDIRKALYHVDAVYRALIAHCVSYGLETMPQCIEQDGVVREIYYRKAEDYMMDTAIAFFSGKHLDTFGLDEAITAKLISFATHGNLRDFMSDVRNSFSEAWKSGARPTGVIPTPK